MDTLIPSMQLHVRPALRCAAMPLLVIVALGAAPGCEKAGSRPDSPRADTPSEPGAARPVATTPARSAAAGPIFRLDCFDAYTECPAVTGMPAISSDGKRVIVPDYGPDTGRDEFVLTVRVVEVATGKVVFEAPLVTYRDHDSGRDPQSDEWTAAFRAELGDRVAAVERALAQGGFQSMVALGAVHQDRPGDEVAGLRARFDGKQLVIDDGGAPRWQRPIAPSTPFDRGDGEICGPFPVADVSAWASREHGVAVARPTYIGSDLCATEYPYFIWR